VISFQAINYFNTVEKFKFNIQGESLDIQTPSELEGEIHFQPGETKTYEVKLVPKTDGFGKFILNVNWLKKVEYTVKVKKIRENASKNRIKKILKNYKISFKERADEFRLEDHIISLDKKEVKKLKKKFENNKTKYEEYKALRDQWEKQDTQGIQKPEPIQEVGPKEIDAVIKQLIKVELANENLDAALELSSSISDIYERKLQYNNSIRAYSFFDLEKSMELIKNLEEDEKKDNLISEIAFDQIRRDPDQAPRVAYLIQDPSKREKLIIDLAAILSETNPDTAIQVSKIIGNELLRIKLIFNILRIVYNKNNKEKSIEILKNLIKDIEKLSQDKLSENKYKNPIYEAYRDCVNLLAQIDTPQSADNTLVSFELRDVKDKVSEDLFDIIYEMVDEVKIRFDPVPVYSQYYLLNTYTSGINEFIKNFSLTGGNTSNNILLQQCDSSILFMSLYSYDFSIFPILDRLYHDLKYNNNKSMAYYLYPSKNNHDKKELNTIFNTINQFGLVKNLQTNPNESLIFNLDFIPYLGHPTLILSDNQQISEIISSKIAKNLSDKVIVKIDNSLFHGGESTANLNQLFAFDNCKIVNLIMSYEFINDYNIFKEFVLCLF
jgi:hypothetical protein